MEVLDHIHTFKSGNWRPYSCDWDQAPVRILWYSNGMCKTFCWKDDFSFSGGLNNWPLMDLQESLESILLIKEKSIIHF